MVTWARVKNALRRLESRLTVGAKFGLLLVLVVLATASGLSYTFYREGVATLERELLNGGLRLTRDLAERSSKHLKNHDTWELYKVAHGVIKGQESAPSLDQVRYATSLDVFGRVAAHSDPIAHPLQSDFIAGGALVNGADPAGECDVHAQSAGDGSTIYHIQCPIIMSGERIGVMAVGVSDADLQRVARTFRNKAIITTALLASLFSIAGFLLSRRMVRPLASLKGRLERLPETITRGVEEEARLAGDEIHSVTRYVGAIVGRFEQVTEEVIIERNKLNHILDGMHAGMIVVDNSFNIEWRNRIYEHWFGANDPRPCFQEDAGDCGCISCPTKNALLYGDTFSCKMERKVRGDGARVFTITAAPVHDSDRRVLGALALYVDITHVVEMEERASRKQQLAMMGEMAAGIAHEIRNPLSSVVAALKMVSNRQGTAATSPQQAERLIEVVRVETDRLNRILTDFLSFTQDRPFDKTPLDLNMLVEETIQLLSQGEARERSVGIVTSLDASLPPVAIDGHKIKQVMWNLLKNALQSIETDGRGKVVISTSVEDDHAVFRVVDNGRGMTPEELRLLFTPFRSRKPGGTGLGMAISKKIVTGHEGRLVVNSEPGKGTEITVCLPLAESLPSRREVWNLYQK